MGLIKIKGVDQMFILSEDEIPLCKFLKEKTKYLRNKNKKLKQKTKMFIKIVKSISLFLCNLIWFITKWVSKSLFWLLKHIIGLLGKILKEFANGLTCPLKEKQWLRFLVIFAIYIVAIWFIGSKLQSLALDTIFPKTLNWMDNTVQHYKPAEKSILMRDKSIKKVINTPVKLKKFKAEKPKPKPTPIEEKRKSYVQVGNWEGLIETYFPPEQWANAKAVMYAESGGNANSTNHNYNGTVDRGLFQINSCHGDCSTHDPEANIRCASELWATQGWHIWVAARKLGIY
jgi:hypothetical protein